MQPYSLMLSRHQCTRIYKKYTLQLVYFCRCAGKSSWQGGAVALDPGAGPL
jgi:hypothetical protein